MNNLAFHNYIHWKCCIKADRQCFTAQ